MKRIIAFILIISILIPQCAFSESDPVIGIWYTYMNLINNSDEPEVDHDIVVIMMNEDHTSRFIDLEFLRNKNIIPSELSMSIVWTRNNDRYLLSDGTDMYIEDDSLFVNMNGIYIRFNRLMAIDYSKDIRQQ